jgi:hypothetical protein
VNGKEDFGIAEVTVVTGITTYSLQSGPEHTLAFDYSN